MTLRSERGSASVVAAAVMCLLVVFVMLCADLTRVLVAASRAQTAADAAALAAAESLALPGSVDPGEAAALFASANGAVLDTCDCPRGALAAEVSVRVEVHGSVLASALGTVYAQARAEAGSGSSSSPSSSPSVAPP